MSDAEASADGVEEPSMDGRGHTTAWRDTSGQLHRRRIVGDVHHPEAEARIIHERWRDGDGWRMVGSEDALEMTINGQPAAVTTTFQGPP